MVVVFEEGLGVFFFYSVEGCLVGGGFGGVYNSVYGSGGVFWGGVLFGGYFCFF